MQLTGYNHIVSSCRLLPVTFKSSFVISLLFCGLVTNAQFNASVSFNLITDFAETERMGSNLPANSPDATTTIGDVELSLLLMDAISGIEKPTATFTWIGGTSNDYNTGSNWNLGTVPGAADDIVIPIANTNPCSINSGSFTVNSITVSATGDFRMAAATSLTIANNVTYTSSVAPSLNCTSTIIFNKLAALTIPAWNYGNLTCANSAARSWSAAGVTGICNTFTPGTGTTYTATVGSTVDYISAASQTIQNVNYYNLSNSGNGPRSYDLVFSGTIDIANVFSPTTGVVTTGSFNTINFSSNSLQTIPTTVYYNINNSGAGNRTLAPAGANSNKITIGNFYGLGLGSISVVNSTVEFTGTSSYLLAGITYHNLIFNSKATGFFNLGSGTALTVNGNLTITSSGTSTLLNIGSIAGVATSLIVLGNVDVQDKGTLQMVTDAASLGGTTNITGNLTISGTGKINLEPVASASAAGIVNINGDFTSTGTSVATAGVGGIVDWGVTGNLTTNGIYIKGNFSHNGAGSFGASTTSAATPAAGFVFNNTGTTRTFSYVSGNVSQKTNYLIPAAAKLQMLTGVTLGTGATPPSTFTLSGTLDCGNQVIAAADAANNIFTFNANSIFITTHSSGVTGNLSGFGAANITGNNGIFQFLGTAQNTGFPPAVTAANRLDWLGNTSLTLNHSFAINNPGNINFTNSGLFYLGASDLTIGSTSVINGSPFSTGKMFVTNGVGHLIRSYTSAGVGIPFTWPIGETTGTTEFSPVTIGTLSPSAAGTIGFRVVDGVHPNMAPVASYASRYWNYVYTGGAYTWGNASFTYDPSDVVVGPEALFKASSWDAAWTVYNSSSAASNVLTITSGPSSANLFTGNDITARADGLLYYRSAVAGPNNWGTLSAWQVSTDPAFISPAPQTPYTEPSAANSGGITIRAGHIINLTTTAIADQMTIAGTGILNINAAGTLNAADGTGTDVTINGTLNINAGGTMTTDAGSLVSIPAGGYLKNSNAISSLGSFTIAGTYEHNIDAGTIPAATWAAGGLCYITGTTAGIPGGLGQNFYDLKWDCNQTADVALANSISGPVQNDFTVVKTNGFDLRLANTETVNLSIGRDLNVTGGTLIMNGGSSSFTAPSSSMTVGRDLAISGTGTFQNCNEYASGANVPAVNITRDINMTGSAGLRLVIAGAVSGFAATPSSAIMNAGRNFSLTGMGTVRVCASTATGTLNVAGNFTHTNGIIDLSAGTADINFNGTVPQIYTSGGTVTTAVNFTVNTNAILDMNTSFISGTGIFTLQNNGSLRMGSPDGIVAATALLGNLRNSGARVLSPLASYIYNGLVSQSTGSNLPNNITGNLTIDNTGTSPANIVTLFTNNTTTAVLNLNNGRFNAGPVCTLLIAAGGIVNGNGGNQLLTGTANDNIIQFNNNGSVQGTPELYNVTTSSGVNFINNARINGNFLINTGGYVNTNSPKYATGSTLIYNTGGSYNRNLEWGTNTALAPSYPYHVIIKNGTTVNFTNATSFDVGCGGDLTLGNPSGAGAGALDLAAMSINDLYVGGDLNIGSAAAGTITMSNTIGGDIYLSGNWNRNAIGTVNFGAGDGRAIFFNGATNSTITAAGGQTFPFAYIDKSAKASKVTLADQVTITDEIGFTKGTVDLGTNNKFLTLVSTASKTARVGQSSLSNTDFVYGATNQLGQFIVQRYVPARRSWRLMNAPLKPGGGTHTVSEAWQERGTPLTGLDYTSANWAASVAADTVGSEFSAQITGGTTTDGFDQSPNNKPSIKYYSAGSWLGPANINATSVNSQEGWMLFVRGDRINYGEITNQYKTPTITTLRPRGQIFIGAKSITSTGITVVGNPYASAVDYNSITRTGAGWPASPTYYVWDPYLGGATGQGAFVTLTWNGTNFTRTSPYGAGSIDNRYIPSGAAIMVDFPAGGGTLTFNETDKNAANTSTAFRPARNQILTVLNTVNADNTTYVSDAALSLFGESFKNRADVNDAAKLDNFTESFGLIREGKIMSIERMKLKGRADTIFYNIRKMQRKNYQLQFVFDRVNVPPATTAFLEDLYLKTKTPVNMEDTTRIDFSVSINEEAAADRFRLVFRRSAVCTGINAFVLNRDIPVSWNVEDEFNINRYEIERSADGELFTVVGSKSSKGYSEKPVSYNWLDASPAPGQYYYRIKCISNNGVVAYSDVAKVTILKSSPELYVFPNPVTGNIIQLQMTDRPAGQYQVRLINDAGQKIMDVSITHNGGTATKFINIEKAVGKAVYNMEVTAPDKNTTVIKVMMDN